jgi:AraC-like DNA-binding protein
MYFVLPSASRHIPGFEGIEYVSRYFKAQTGMTPREYRLRYGRG